MSLELLSSARTASSLPVIEDRLLPHKPFRHPSELRTKQVPPRDTALPSLLLSSRWKRQTASTWSPAYGGTTLPKIDVSTAVSPDVSAAEGLARQDTLMTNLLELRKKRNEFFGSVQIANERVAPLVYLRDDQRMRRMRLDGRRSAARQPFGVYDYKLPPLPATNMHPTYARVPRRM